MTEQKQQLPTAIQVVKGPVGEYYRADREYDGELPEGDELVRRSDVEQLIQNKKEICRERLRELEEDHLLSDSEMNNSDVMILRKRESEKLNILRELLEEVHNTDE